MTAPGSRGPQELHELPVDECLCLLAAMSVGRLGLTAPGGPVILPVNYALDGRTVIFRTAEGGKLDAAVGGAPVAFQVDRLQPADESGWSVLVRGTAEVVSDPAELDRARELLAQPWAPGERQHVVRIRPESVTGRTIPSPAALTGLGDTIMVAISDEPGIQQVRHRLP